MYLVARLSPGFADVAVWWVPIVVLGLATMAGRRLAGARAARPQAAARLRHRQPARASSWCCSARARGSRRIAGIAMLLAHGLFKAPLFLVVGTIDHATGTRDLRASSPGCGPSLRGSAITAAAGGRVDGRAAAAARLRRQGGRVRGVPRRGRPARPARHARRWSRARCSPWPTARGSCGARSPASRAWPTPRCTRPGALLTVAGRAVRGRRARAGHREPRGRRRRAELRRRLPGHVAGGGRLPPRAVARLRPAAAGVRQSRSCSGYALHRGWGRGRPARRPRAARAVGASTATSSPSAGPNASRPSSPGGCRSGRVPTYLTVILVTVVALPGTAVLVGGTWPDQPVAPRAAAAAPGRRGDPRGARAGPRAAAVHRGAAGRGRSATASAGCSSSTAPRTSRWPSSSSRRCRWSRSSSCCAGCPPTSPASSGRSRVQLPKAVIAAVGGRDGRRDGGGAQRRPAGAGDDQRRVHPARPRGGRRD